MTAMMMMMCGVGLSADSTPVTSSTLLHPPSPSFTLLHLQVMSDWGAQHHGAPGGYGQGGLDQSMPGGNVGNMQKLLDGGNMSLADVDETVVRILTPMFAMGLFESVDAHGELLNKSRGVHANVTSAEHNAVTRSLAARAMVLLKNSGEVLPLSGSALSTIAVVGMEAAKPAVHGGGSGQVFPYYISDPLSAIRRRFAGAANCSTAGGGEHCVVYNDGKDLESVPATCQQADVAVVFVMANSGEGKDRITLELTNSWNGQGPTMTPLIEAVARACKKTVVVMVSPGAVLTPWRDEVDAIVAATMPGQEYGNAVADGEKQPSGQRPPPSLN
jgi:beta-glucosidase